VASDHALDESKTLVRGGAGTTEARNGVVKRRPHRSFTKGRGNRTDQGARLIREMGRYRSYASLARRSGSVARRNRANDGSSNGRLSRDVDASRTEPDRHGSVIAATLARETRRSGEEPRRTGV
jgi:hypothetical protein